jgi:hypothetical protein
MAGHGTIQGNTVLQYLRDLVDPFVDGSLRCSCFGVRSLSGGGARLPHAHTVTAYLLAEVGILSCLLFQASNIPSWEGSAVLI